MSTTVLAAGACCPAGAEGARRQLGYGLRGRLAAVASSLTVCFSPCTDAVSSSSSLAFTASRLPSCWPWDFVIPSP